ncbi:DNA-binding CsgD family transcriptional regulator [Chryseobacterium sp. SORGH_AS 447]|uniref:response regulator transcription factor n=1 Tax=Chryseobacterium sp. SORGH_AS_0447 TaxID=3041769 RepID=UPI0027840F00|nr:LuxR C-terminal-related transcriptional regulator [Chryseobacterium sp. SORGH_AS_0447]MDQ1162336.1 DNA-binding CsgD family transcriptional regulator [Chryseobacterium sp. SORGH_AS_0447]
MEIVETLNKTLLSRNREKSNNCTLDLERFKNMALSYSEVENSIAVLSDMHANQSYIYYSETAEVLGIHYAKNPKVIDSIWEEDILHKIHPDDKLKKYVHELRFFKMLEKIDIKDRSKFSVLSKLRKKDKDDRYILVQHRMFYFYSPDSMKLRFALCLYNIAVDQSPYPSSEFLIINSAKGEVVTEDKLTYKNVLSAREMEILKYIGEGLTSKEIAQILSISINTVSRHRQNILEKLNVKNSVKAFSDSFGK